MIIRIYNPKIYFLLPWLQVHFTLTAHFSAMSLLRIHKKDMWSKWILDHFSKWSEWLITLDLGRNVIFSAIQMWSLETPWLTQAYTYINVHVWPLLSSKTSFFWQVKHITWRGPDQLLSICLPFPQKLSFLLNSQIPQTTVSIIQTVRCKASIFLRRSCCKALVT